MRTPLALLAAALLCAAPALAIVVPKNFNKVAGNEPESTDDATKAPAAAAAPEPNEKPLSRDELRALSPALRQKYVDCLQSERLNHQTCFVFNYFCVDAPNPSVAYCNGVIRYAFDQEQARESSQTASAGRPSGGAASGKASGRAKKAVAAAPKTDAAPGASGAKSAAAEAPLTPEKRMAARKSIAAYQKLTAKQKADFCAPYKNHFMAQDAAAATPACTVEEAAKDTTACGTDAACVKDVADRCEEASADAPSSPAKSSVPDITDKAVQAACVILNDNPKAAAGGKTGARSPGHGGLTDNSGINKATPGAGADGTPPKKEADPKLKPALQWGLVGAIGGALIGSGFVIAGTFPPVLIGAVAGFALFAACSYFL